MKNLFNKICAIVIVVTFVLPLFAANSAAGAEDSVFFIRPEDNAGLTFSVGSYEKSSRDSYMFLPNTVDKTNVTVRYNGSLSTVSGTAVTEWNADEGYFTVDTTAADSITAGRRKLYFMQSSLPSMNIVLNEGESLDTINADKEAKIDAKVAINGTDGGEYDLAYTDIQMKTRGNTTFWPDKKPYQIKFDKKQDLFGMGKAKKWILLANYYDGTSVRTKVFFDLADEIGLEYSGKSTFVDLYIDGDYRGVYQLTEKIEVGSSRVDLKDDYGVILEMEANDRLDTANDIYFVTYESEKFFVFKDYVFDLEDTSTPEKAAKAGDIMWFTEEYIDALEDAMYARYPDWDTISSMIDVDSFALYYLLNEYGEQVDCMLSSTYFYIDGPDDVLHCGPVWDFDRVCGFNDPIPKNTDFVKNMNDNTDGRRAEWYKELFRNPEFVRRVNELYEERVKDAVDTAKINAAIDALQAKLMPSLLMNHVKWVVFYNRSYTADELVSTGTVDRIAYTTNSVKGILRDKKAYMDIAYCECLPTISLVTYDDRGREQKNYTGGCITYESALTGMKIDLIDSPFDGQIRYWMNINGTQTDASTGGEINKDSSGFTRANGIYIKLEGNITNYVDLQYRVRVGGRWSAWKTNGAIAGRSSSNNGQYYIDRIQIRLLKKADVVYSDIELVAAGFDTVCDREVVGNEYDLGAYVPEKEGYTFTGWYTDDNRTVPADTPFIAEEGHYTFFAGYERNFRYGDIDGNGRVNMRDLKCLRSLMAGYDFEFIFDAADLYSDGRINSRDVRMMRTLISGEIGEEDIGPVD